MLLKCKRIFTENNFRMAFTNIEKKWCKARQEESLISKQNVMWLVSCAPEHEMYQKWYKWRKEKGNGRTAFIRNTSFSK